MNEEEIVHIKEPFYSAGYKYNWLDYYIKRPVGLGVNLKKLAGEGLLTLKVGTSDTLYQIEKQRAREIVAKHNAYYEIGTTTLGILPWAVLRKKQTEPQARLPI